jgi:acyl-CoA reductase-like NAD-dependent aldehyde dehydrogenase
LLSLGKWLKRLAQLMTAEAERLKRLMAEEAERLMT